MDTQHIARLTADDVQALENVLQDTHVDGLTRRALIGRAAATAAVVSAVAPGAALGQAPANQVSQIIDTAITAEALAVTYLSGIIQNASATGVSKFADVLKAANASEYDHFKALQSLGAKPLTTKFWAPDAFFAPGAPFKVLEIAETLFINAYLIGTTAFVTAGKPDYARYAAEIGGVEAQHLALVRFARNELPDDRAFQSYAIKDINGIVAALEKAGVGFGKPGKKPGKFYTFAPPPASTVTSISNNSPM